MKGIETVRKDWCGLTEKVLSKTLELLLKDGSIEAAVNHVRMVIRDLEEGNTSIEDLIITKSLSRNIHEYKGVQPHVELVKKMMKRSPEKTPMIGDRVNFVIVAGPDLVSKRAEDPEYVLERRLKIDTKYYIENQILPPIERIFEAVGIKKSVLFSNGKQLKLTVLSEKQNKVSENHANLVVLNNLTIDDKTKNLEFENFVCEKCGRIYFSLPFDGRCYDCKNKIGFSFNNHIFFTIER
jgi:DNA polymerase I